MSAWLEKLLERALAPPASSPAPMPKWAELEEVDEAKNALGDDARVGELLVGEVVARLRSRLEKG